MSDINKIIDDATKKFVDDGKLIEAGWQAYRMLSIPPDAPDIQVSECRLAFFFGAQHLFASLTSIFDDGGEEPTMEDLKRMDIIDAELREFIERVKAGKR